MDFVSLFSTELISEKTVLPTVRTNQNIRQLYSELKELFYQYQTRYQEFHKGKKKFLDQVGLVARVSELCQDDNHSSSVSENLPEAVKDNPILIRKRGEDYIKAQQREVLDPLEQRLKQIPSDIEAEIRKHLAKSPIPLDLRIHTHEDPDKDSKFSIFVINELSPEQTVCLFYGMTGKIPTSLDFIHDPSENLPYDSTMARLFGGETYTPFSRNSFSIPLAEYYPASNAYLDYVRCDSYYKNLLHGIRQIRSSEMVVPVKGHLPIKIFKKEEAGFSLYPSYSEYDSDMESEFGDNIPSRHMRVVYFSTDILDDCIDGSSHSRWYESYISCKNKMLSEEQSANFFAHIIKKQKEGIVRIERDH